MKAWRRTRWVEGVRYYVPSGATRRWVERAVERMNATERVELRAIEPLLGRRWSSESSVEMHGR